MQVPNPDTDKKRQRRKDARPAEIIAAAMRLWAERGFSATRLEDVAAGANIVANVATLVNTGVMTSVTAVMGDYHQIDAITQAYIYSDRDEISSVFTHSEDVNRALEIFGVGASDAERHARMLELLDLVKQDEQYTAAVAYGAFKAEEGSAQAHRKRVLRIVELKRNFGLK